MLDIHKLVESEMHDVERSVRLAKAAWEGAIRYPDQQDHFLSSLALNLHSFYNGLERIFEALARRLDRSFPLGDRWHKELLEQMGRELPEVRSSVLSPESVANSMSFWRFAIRSAIFTLSISNLEGCTNCCSVCPMRGARQMQT